jgi:hypothetical protein
MADNRFSIDYAKREVKKGEGDFEKPLMIQSVFVVQFMKLAVGTSNFNRGIFLDLFNDTVRPDWICMRVLPLYLLLLVLVG